MQDLRTEDDSRVINGMTFNSRPFMTPEACFHAMQADITRRIEKLSRKTGGVTRIDEMNPTHVSGAEELEAQMQADETVREYVSTWSDDTITRVTIVTEELDEDANPIEVYDQLEAYVLRYELCDFDDDLDIQLSATSTLIEEAPSSLQ